MEGCPSDLWEQLLADALPISHPVLVNVGANKGYKIPPFLSLWKPLPTLTPQNWYGAILMFAELRKSGQLKWAGSANHKSRSSSMTDPQDKPWLSRLPNTTRPNKDAHG